MSIRLADFQLRAISSLFDAMSRPERDIILKSCTGSGKTIILTHFMAEYCKSRAGTVFIWLTPGAGDLEEQSKAKMDKYIHGAQTKLLSDVMTSGFEENDACFINWEKLTKKGNNALKDSERASFLEHIKKALADGLSFVVIVDESHHNDTVNSDKILRYFKTGKIIRASATPRNGAKAIVIDIPEEDVIAEGLIKKLLIINEDFEQNVEAESQIDYLLTKALEKQRALKAEFARLGAGINPLIVVQIPNKNDVLLDSVERWFEIHGVTYENRLLAVWLSDKKQNTESIEENDASPLAVIIKQAIATGWDCPRAHILVKLRDNMDETFEVQTIGRIRRMPEARHYESELLDSCYLYTFDEKFTEGVRASLGSGALLAATLYLKPEHYGVTLKSEQRSSLSTRSDARQAIKAIWQYFDLRYHTSTASENRSRLEAQGYIFDSDVLRYTISGKVVSLEEAISAGNEGMNTITIREKLSTHEHGRLYHHRVSEIGLKLGLEYSQLNAIFRRLFDASVPGAQKLLLLDTRDVYAFVINNSSRLKDDIRGAMAAMLEAQQMIIANVHQVDFTLPRECRFTYDDKAKSQRVMSKNVYDGYLESAEPRSGPERKFEQYCQTSPHIKWFYKNGDKGAEFLSIVYMNNFNKQKAFYPDYILGTDDGIWIIDTKGGFDRMGNSEDIDRYSAKKFEVLKQYLNKHGLRGGFVREDGKSGQLCLCEDGYTDDISSDAWKLLRDIL